MIAEVRQVGCFPSTPSAPADAVQLQLRGKLNGASLSTFERHAEGLTIARAVSGVEEEALWLRSYLETRETLLILAFTTWGQEGLERMQRAFAAPGHAEIVSQIGARLGEPAFAASLAPLTRAKMQSLAARPADYLPCVALAPADAT